MNQHISEYAAGLLDVGRRRRAGVPAGDDQHFRDSDITRFHAAVRFTKSRVKATLKTNHAADARIRYRLRDNVRTLDREIHWLFTEYVFARRHCTRNELAMGGCG